jgi:hypothetical protein
MGMDIRKKDTDFVKCLVLKIIFILVNLDLKVGNVTE